MLINNLVLFPFSLKVKATGLCSIASFHRMASNSPQQTVTAICVSLVMVQVIVTAR